MLGHFALNLAYFLRAEAKSANADATSEYASKPHDSYAQDCAFERMVETAELAELACDCAVEAEDNAWLARNGVAA